MTDKAIPDLPAIGGLDGTEVVHFVDTDGNSRKVALSALKAFINTDPTIVPSSEPWKGCKINRSSVLTGLTFPYLVSWNNEVEDTDGFWNSGAPTRIVIPAGITRVQLSASIDFESDATAGTITLQLMKNGVGMTGCSLYNGRHGATGFNNNVAQCYTWDDVCVAGDYYEVRANKSGLAAIDQIQNSIWTWFQCKVIEHSL